MKAFFLDLWSREERRGKCSEEIEKKRNDTRVRQLRKVVAQKRQQQQQQQRQ